MTAYSECKNKKCTCRAGFTVKEDTCAPQGLYVKGTTCILLLKSHISEVIPKGNNQDIKCPVGLPHPTAICEQLADNYCPYVTHECYNDTTCCPRDCSVQMININGKCYSRMKFLHHSCEFQQQCLDPNTDCINGNF